MRPQLITYGLAAVLVGIAFAACGAAEKVSPYYARQHACVENYSTKADIDACRCDAGDANACRPVEVKDGGH